MGTKTTVGSTALDLDGRVRVEGVDMSKALGAIDVVHGRLVYCRTSPFFRAAFASCLSEHRLSVHSQYIGQQHNGIFLHIGIQLVTNMMPFFAYL